MSSNVQLSLFDETPVSIDTLILKREDQWFDRKSIRVEPSPLADCMIGFANADGGRIVIGIHNKEVEGIDAVVDHVNDLMQAAINFSSPPVRHGYKFLDCINNHGIADRLLLIDVEASESIHRNKKNECFLRVGDENRKLGPTEERELAFDKGESFFDCSLASDTTLDDLKLEDIKAYAQKLGAIDETAVMRSRGLYSNSPKRTGVTQAGWLLFGKYPPLWSAVRFIRYSGIQVETGPRSNVVKDVRIEDTVPQLIERTMELLRTEIGTVIRLTSSGRFEPVPKLPEFAWLEAVVNALTHRSYSLQGDCVRISLFDDRLVVESPGRLPGLVQIQNIRNCRYSRNPHIARVLAEMTGYVRELNEGVNRIYQEMELHGLHDPVFTSTGSVVKVTLYITPVESAELDIATREEILVTSKLLITKFGNDIIDKFIDHFDTHGSITTRTAVTILKVTVPTARKYLTLLEQEGFIKEHARSKNDPAAVWILIRNKEWDYFKEGLKEV